MSFLYLDVLFRSRYYVFSFSTEGLGWYFDCHNGSSNRLCGGCMSMNRLIHEKHLMMKNLSQTYHRVHVGIN